MCTIHNNLPRHYVLAEIKLIIFICRLVVMSVRSFSRSFSATGASSLVFDVAIFYIYIFFFSREIHEIFTQS